MRNPKNRPKLKATHPSDPSRPKSKDIELLDDSAYGMGQRLRKLLDRLPKRAEMPPASLKVTLPTGTSDDEDRIASRDTDSILAH